MTGWKYALALVVVVVVVVVVAASSQFHSRNIYTSKRWDISTALSFLSALDFFFLPAHVLLCFCFCFCFFARSFAKKEHVYIWSLYMAFSANRCLFRETFCKKWDMSDHMHGLWIQSHPPHTLRSASNNENGQRNDNFFSLTFVKIIVIIIKLLWQTGSWLWLPDLFSLENWYQEGGNKKQRANPMSETKGIFPTLQWLGFFQVWIGFWFLVFLLIIFRRVLRRLPSHLSLCLFDELFLIFLWNFLSLCLGHGCHGSNR